jgi:hypothetical protein
VVVLEFLDPLGVLAVVVVLVVGELQVQVVELVVLVLPTQYQVHQLHIQQADKGGQTLAPQAHHKMLQHKLEMVVLELQMVTVMVEMVDLELLLFVIPLDKYLKT